MNNIQINIANNYLGQDDIYYTQMLCGTDSTDSKFANLQVLDNSKKKIKVWTAISDGLKQFDIEVIIIFYILYFLNIL